jgi:hypothetical protein
MLGWILLIAAGIVHAQDTPPATAVGPWRTGVAVTCPDGHTIPANTVISGPDVTPAELCGSNSSGGTSGTSPASNVKISNTGNLKQDLLTNGTNLFIASRTTNPIVSNFMQSAATSFISSMFANSAEAQRQQALMSQEILRRQQEQEQQRRIAEQQRLDAMFARLSRELKLEGLPFNLSLKGMSSSDPNALQLKGMSSSGPGDLKLKISDANPTAYGIKGLPGIYVGGPAGGEGSAPDASTSGNTNNPNAVAGNPNLVSGPGTGTTGPGIAGLPGIYLDGVQPGQAPQLAQAAQTMSGSERDVAEDTALHAAQTNPALNAPSQDPGVQNFQQANQEYQQALVANAAASQDLQTAQAHVDADKSAVDVARTQLSAITPSVEQQQAFDQMIAAAKTDEDASMLARQNFDSTRIQLSATRDRATAALAETAPAIDLRGTNSTTVANLKTPTPASFPAVPAIPASAMSKPRSIAPVIPNETQLRTRLEGMQHALRRLMEDEAKRGEARKEAEADVNEAVEDAEDRGVDMAFDLFLTGWDHCAPALDGGVIGKFERDAKRADEQIQQVYKEASETKDMSELGALNQKAEELDRTKKWLEDSIHQFERYKLRLDQLHSEKDAAEVIEKSNGDWESSLEGLGKVIQMGLDSKRVVSFLQLSECGVVTVKAGASVIDSVYDIFKEGDAAEGLRRLDDNTTEFLAAQKSIQSQIKRTVAQLNCYKLPDPAAVVSCVGAVAH